MFVPPSSTRKRKRGDDRSLSSSPFVVQPLVASSFDVSTKISPTVILPRSHVPINWLAGAPARIFDIPAGNPALCSPRYVAIVKIEGERQLSALEKIGDNIYALYRLSTQLRMKDIRKVAAQTKNLPCEQIGGPMHDVCEQEWWSGIGSVEYPFEDAPITEAALDMGVRESGMAEHAAKDHSCPDGTPLVPDPLPKGKDHQDPAAQEDVQPTMSEVLEQVQRQYFDTLYLAKTSLAYFAKSTLSRARAACHDFESILPIYRFDELIEFLRRMILPLDKMDLKYRMSLVQMAQEHDVDDPSVFRPEEDGYIQRWRQAAFQERFIRGNDIELKQKLEELKIRETELQIILLLEILALEKQRLPVAAATETTGGKGKTKKEKKKKTKKAKGVNKTLDPDVLLDLLVDRLCIWHLIGSDATRDRGADSPAKGKGVVSEKDHLRHFSVEVIMAFYSSKLPEKCASINKKFGGRNAPSAAPANVLRQTKHLNDRRSVAKKAPGLSRVNSAQSTSSRGSTTTESIALLASEGAAAPRAIRGGTLNSKSFTKKIVQMNIQKKADEELKSVIQALAKPNRAAAATELVEDAEKRLAKTFRKPKKLKASSNVHVAATPQKRNKDIFAGSLKNTRPANQQHHQPLSSRQMPSEVAATPPSRYATNSSHLDDGVVLSTPRKGIFAELQRSADRQPKIVPRSAPAVANEVDTIFSTPPKSSRVG